MIILTSSELRAILNKDSMITRFRVKNFRSIVDMELGLNYDEGKAPNGYKAMTSWAFLENKQTQQRVVPSLALYGANASGKSNIINALSDFINIVRFGYLAPKNTVTDSFQPNRIHINESISEYTIEGVSMSHLIKYELAFSSDKDKIAREKLTVDGKVLFEANEAQISIHPMLELPDYQQERLQSIYQVECCSNESQTRKQVGIYLHVLGENYPGLNLLVELSYTLFWSIWALPVFSIKEIAHVNLTNREQVVTLLKQFDLDIVDVKYDKEGKIKTYHLNHKKEKVEFELADESLGTQNLLGVLGLVTYALDKGITLVLDELDRSIHPIILIEIVRLFKSKEYNKNDAQLIFTTHTTDLLDAEQLLRVSEVAIINKSKLSGTKVTRLSEFEDLRNVKNFRKSYINGEFRGIPYPFI